MPRKFLTKQEHQPTDQWILSSLQRERVTSLPPRHYIFFKIPESSGIDSDSIDLKQKSDILRKYCDLFLDNFSTRDRGKITLELCYIGDASCIQVGVSYGKFSFLRKVFGQ